jgi:zinc protease
MWTAPGVEDAAACVALELELLEAWHREGITEEELAQCKSFLSRSYAFEIDTPHKRMQQKLERFLLDLPEDFHTRYLDRLAAVTRDEANAAVRRHLSPADLWIATVGDAAALRSALEAACGALAETRIESVDVA